MGWVEKNAYPRNHWGRKGQIEVSCLHVSLQNKKPSYVAQWVQMLRRNREEGSGKAWFSQPCCSTCWCLMEAFIRWANPGDPWNFPASETSLRVASSSLPPHSLSLQSRLLENFNKNFSYFGASASDYHAAFHLPPSWWYIYIYIYMSELVYLWFLLQVW